MIERYLIRYFLSVVEEGNFSRAAAKSGVTQPTLSVGISKLEQALNAVLFERSNRRVELTESGNRFLVHARRIEGEFAAAERLAGENAPARLVRVGIASSLPAAWIQRAVSEAMSGGSTERLEVSEGKMRDLLIMLDRGRVDAVVGPVTDDRPVWLELFREGYAMALPKGHHLSGQTSIDASDVASEAMIVRRHCEALQETSRYFTARGVRPFMSARTTSDERAVAFVRSGLGLTVMPDSMASDGLAFVRLSGFSLVRRMVVIVDPASMARLEDSSVLSRLGEALIGLHADRLTACKEV